MEEIFYWVQHHRQVAGLLEEIKKSAIEKQSDLFNKVRLMEAKQEPDKAMRTFVARLHRLANICILSTKCKEGLTPHDSSAVLRERLRCLLQMCQGQVGADGNPLVQRVMVPALQGWI